MKKPASNEFTTPPDIVGTIENRYVCSVLDSIRDCDKTKTYGHLLGLVEQVQEYVNRMENGLSNTNRTARQAYKLLQSKKTAEAMKKLKERWPNIDSKNGYVD